SGAPPASGTRHSERSSEPFSFRRKYASRLLALMNGCSGACPIQSGSLMICSSAKGSSAANASAVREAKRTSVTKENRAGVMNFMGRLEEERGSRRDRFEGAAV